MTFMLKVGNRRNFACKEAHKREKEDTGNENTPNINSKARRKKRKSSLKDLSRSRTPKSLSSCCNPVVHAMAGGAIRWCIPWQVPQQVQRANTEQSGTLVPVQNCMYKVRTNMNEDRKMDEIPRNTQGNICWQ